MNPVIVNLPLECEAIKVSINFSCVFSEGAQSMDRARFRRPPAFLVASRERQISVNIFCFLVTDLVKPIGIDM